MMTVAFSVLTLYGQSYRPVRAQQAPPTGAHSLAACRDAVARNPRDPKAHKDLGNALSDFGQYALAVTEYQTAIRLDPHYAKAYHNLGLALYGEGDYVGAVRALQEAIRLQPVYPLAEAGLGMTYRAQGQLKQAVAAYRVAVQGGAGQHRLPCRLV